jgi:hypothetical protein
LVLASSTLVLIAAKASTMDAILVLWVTEARGGGGAGGRACGWRWGRRWVWRG